MLAFTIYDTKIFMALLLKGNTFDAFELRSLDVTTFASFQISGKRNKEFYNLDEQEFFQTRFCSWKEIRPYAFEVIKGTKLPKSIKIVFSLEENELQKFDNASALFLNIQFENNEILCTTGCSQIEFSLDKSLDYNWDQWILSFFQKNNIGIEQKN